MQSQLTEKQNVRGLLKEIGNKSLAIISIQESKGEKDALWEHAIKINEIAHKLHDFMD